MDESRDEPRPLRSVWRILPLALLAAALGTALSLRVTTSLQLIGWDAYPAVSASRVESFGGFWELLSTSFMADYHPRAAFFRPLTALSLGLDHALHGLEPAGYHFMSLLLHVGAAAAVGLLVRALTAGRVAPLLAALVFALHPAHEFTVPFVSRRGEVLSLLFGAAALVARERGRLPAAAILCLVAASAKETGLLFAPILVHRQLSDRSSLPRLVAWLIGGLVPYFAWRASILGGLGGYGDVGDNAIAFTEFAPRLMHVQLHGESGGAALEVVFPWVALVLLGTLSAALWSRRAGRGWLTSGPFVLAAAWLALSVVQVAAAVDFSPWYAYIPLGLIVAAVAAAGHHAANVMQHGVRARSIAAIGSLAAMGVLAVGWALVSVRNADHERLVRASDVEKRYLAVLSEALAHDPPPRVVSIRPSPSAIGPEFIVLAPYTVRAWANVVHPHLDVRAYHPDYWREDIRGADAVGVEFFGDSVPDTGEIPEFEVRLVPR